jgi:hypothetical protein
MLKIKKILPIMGICLVLFGFGIAKLVDVPTEITAVLDKYYKNNPIEKLYVQTDKTQYLSGEKIWFKAVVCYDDTAFSSLLSKVLYVELLDSKHNLVVQRTLPITNQTAIGDFSISDSLRSGNYELRCYTTWLRNFGEDYFFHKTLQITQNLASANAEISKTPKEALQGEYAVKNPIAKPILQFFPEGGDMVAMLRNQVAFKATDSTGKSVKVEGVIQDTQGKVCAVFKSNDMGLGSFRIVPLGSPLVAKIMLKNGDTISYKLPAVLEKGLVLGIKKQIQDSVVVLLQSNLNSFANNHRSYYFVAQIGGKIVAITKVLLQETGQLIKINTQNLPTGVLHLTLIDENKIPHCERLVFINQQTTMDIVIQANKKKYKARNKVELALETFLPHTQQSQATEAELSVLVLDNSLVTASPNEENILTRLLLTADLKGKVENPAHYLAQTAEARQDLDYLMMTQGWRRFKWRELLKGDYQQSLYPIQQGLFLAGTVANDNAKLTPAIDANLTMMVNNKLENIFSTNTDSTGRFLLSGFSFYDSVPVLITSLSKKNSQYVKILLDKPRLPISTYQCPPFAQTINDAYREATKQNIGFIESFYFDKKTTMLESVEVIAKKEKVIDYKEGTIVLYGNPDNVIKDPTIFQSLGGQNPLLALQGRVPGVSVVQDLTTNEIIVSTRNGTPVILYDGMIVDANFLYSIPAHMIAAVEVIKRPATIYGGNGGGGVIAFYSKKGNNDTPISFPNKLKTKLNGFYTAQEFFSPNYDTLKMANPDSRTTIYWNPRVKTNDKGKTVVTFFTADLATSYKIIVEGIAKKGTMLGRKEYEVEVIK